MTLRFFSALLVSLALFAGLPAHACMLVSDDDGTTRDGLTALEPGTFVGRAQCNGRRMPISIWTMGVDGSAPQLGVRDDPLFQMLPANPLRTVARVGYDRNVHFTLFRRDRQGDGTARRLFATVCADGRDPLNCSLGDRRVKIRVDLRDTDDDGRLDMAYHQISIYDGASRLQVIYVNLPVTARAHSMVGQWIELFGETGAVDLDRVL